MWDFITQRQPAVRGYSAPIVLKDTFFNFVHTSSCAYKLLSFGTYIQHVLVIGFGLLHLHRQKPDEQYILPTLSDCAGATKRLFVRLLFISAEPEEQLTFFTAGGPHWKDTSFRDHCRGLNYVRHQHMSKSYSNKSHASQKQFSLNSVKQNTPSMRYNVSLIYVFLNRGIKNHLVTTNYNWWMNDLMSWKSARAHIQKTKPLHYST